MPQDLGTTRLTAWDMAARRIERILLLQPRWMGDVLLCTPAIREARRAFPDAVIDFVTEGPGGEVLRRNPYLDEVLVDDRTPRRRLALLRRAAAGRYDAVVDFRSTGSTAQLTLASRAGLRVGIRGRGPRNLVYNRLVPRLGLDTYAARHKLDMLAPLGVDVGGVHDLSLDLPVGEAARERAARFWTDHGLEGSPVVAVSPASREGFKQWGTERWARIADMIVEQGARLLFTHGPGEEDQLAEVAAAMRAEPVWRYGPTTIEEVAALLEKCVLWVGNDGGAKHIAGAVGLPTVTVIRWRIGRVWTDPAPRASQWFVDHPPPGPCDQRCTHCARTGCLAALPVEEVGERVRRSLVEIGAVQ